MISKKDIRNTVLDIRKNFDTNSLKIYSKIICNRVIREQLYLNCENIALYMAISNEVGLDELLQDAYDKGKKIWLPKVINKEMDFYSYTKDTELITGAYNIPEPNSHEILVPNEKTLIIMPGAVFSKDRARIGYGGGYYDKYLCKYPQCKTIAVCYNFQIMPWIPSDEHDIKPNMIISNEDIFKEDSIC